MLGGWKDILIVVLVGMLTIDSLLSHVERIMRRRLAAARRAADPRAICGCGHCRRFRLAEPCSDFAEP